jgi:hypothetical protein
MGLSFFFASLASFVFFLKRPKLGYDKVLYGAILILCGFLLYRVNPLLTLFNTIGIILLGSVMTVTKNAMISFANLLFSPLQALSGVFNTSNEFHFNRDLLKHPQKISKAFNWVQLVQSVLITLGLLIVVVPLLASANPIFNKLVSDFFSGLHLDNILKFLFGEGLEIHIGRILLAILLFLFSTRLSSFAYSKPEGEAENVSIVKQDLSALFLLPKIVLSFVILLFFVTQIQLYSANTDTLKAIGYTNSKQVNEVFGQLSIVSLIVFALIYNDRSKKKFKQIKYICTDC